jgi:predicted nucleic-acid-binding Zn-ribbon protein
MNQVLKFTCPKCGNKQYEIGEMWVSSNLFSRIFDIQGKRFTNVTCQKCRYTEFYKTPQKSIGEVFNNLAR